MAFSVAAAEEASSNVEKCSRNLGSIAVSEPQGQGASQLTSYGLGSPVAVLRMMIQQSGCFTVVERGVAMQNIQQERALAQGGELTNGSNIGKGQMQAADFVMTPNVLFAQNTGGVGGAVSHWGHGLLGAIGGLAGGLKFKEAQTSLMIADVRSSIQIAAAEGVAKKTDFSVGGWGFGGAGFGAAGGYTKTPEGKIIAASLLDNYNKIVATIRDQPNLVHNANENSANAAAATQAGTAVNAGDLLHPKINNIRVFAEPRSNSKVMGTIQKDEELIATGETEAGFIKVDSARFSGGWVQKTMVSGQQTGGVVMAPAPIPMQMQATTVQIGAVAVYSGSYLGEENGTFNFTITNNGAIVGTGESGTYAGRFRITGNLNPGGIIAMTATGTAGAAIFQGIVDQATGKVSGSWRHANGKGSGTFNGQKL